LIEGTLESLEEDGIFRGWLRDTDSATPALLEIRHRAEPVAQCAAQAFRPDLLASGHGHGHFGFAARLLRPLHPGPAEFELFLPQREQAIRVRLTVPPLAPPPPGTVEQLLTAPPIWTVGDLCRAPGCLELPAARAMMGTPRFVDVTFRFALTRWPSDAESAVYVRALDDEGTKEEDFLVELLTCRERADLPPALPSPWDALFPYSLSPTRADAA
jgi:hypothetical protein